MPQFNEEKKLVTVHLTVEVNPVAPDVVDLIIYDGERGRMSPQAAVKAVGVAIQDAMTLARECHA